MNPDVLLDNFGLEAEVQLFPVPADAGTASLR
jgi:hypothetical protein